MERTGFRWASGEEGDEKHQLGTEVKAGEMRHLWLGEDLEMP